MTKPIALGRGFTPMYVTVVLDEEAYDSATKRHKKTRHAWADVANFHACCLFFEAQTGYAPFCIVYLAPRFRATHNGMALLAHEFVHCKQHCERVMSTRMDDETEAYYVQNLMLYAWPKIKKRRGK